MDYGAHQPPLAGTIPQTLDQPQVFRVGGWETMGDARRVAFIRRIVTDCGRDPRIRELAVDIVRNAGAQPRDYKGQAAALLRWVQENIYYVNEPDEQLQDPMYTLRVKHGDCDDEAILLCALAQSIRLPNALVISGTDRQGRMVRWIEGERIAPRRDVRWAHIYVALGWPPFQPQQWAFAEPTAKVPFGWDVVQARAGTVPMPEFGAIALTDKAQELLAKEIPVVGVKYQRIVEAVLLGAASAFAGQLIAKHFAKKKRR